MEENHDEINILRDEAERSVDYSSYAFPEKYFGASNDDEVDLIISNEIKDIKITGELEFVNIDGLLLFNYHMAGKEKEFINIFKAFNLTKRKEILSDVLNKSANAFAPDSFFVYKNLVILLKEKREIILLEIKQ